MTLLYKSVCSQLKSFRQNQDGAVTVDWVVLVAAVVGLGTIVVGKVATATDEYAGDIRVCTNIIGNRMIKNTDGTAADYNRELRIAARNCARPR